MTASGKSDDSGPVNGDRDDACIIPGKPVPPEEVARYSPVRDPHLEGNIADYVHGQASDETVRHVEKVKTEAIMGTQYEVWDVTTDKNRWWVVTNPTNLYSQEHFQSLDYTLSFHVGLMMRVQSRRQRAEEASPFDEVLRRMGQAADRFERAVENEEYQAVGMQLRECLLSLVAAVRRRVDIEETADAPKGAAFIEWSNLLLDALCPGAGNKAIRQYMKTTAEKAWQLVSSLTHDRDEPETSAQIALQGCETLIAQYLQLLVRREAGDVAKCPECSSRQIRSHFDQAITPDGQYYNTCGSCGWTNHPTDGGVTAEGK